MRSQILVLLIICVFVPQSLLQGGSRPSLTDNRQRGAEAKGVVCIKGKLLNFKGDKTYLVDVSDKAGLRIPENITIEPGPGGEFEVKFHLEGPSYYKLEGNTIYLSPGDDLQIVIDCLDREKTKFKGKGSEACNYLKTIPVFLDDVGYLGKDYKNILKYINEFISQYMLPRAEKSLKEISELKNVTDEFRELERARVKSNVVMSLMFYSAGYARKFVEGFDIRKDMDLLRKIREEHINSSKKVLMEYGEGLARAENIVLPEFRKILVWVKNGGDGKELPAYRRVDRIEDYELTYDLLQEYASCFTRPDRNIDDALSGLEAAKERITTQLYKDLIDKSIKQYGEISKGAPVFDFTGYDTEGRPVKLSQFKGKYIYLDFWATWCGPCIKEYPFFQELYHKFGEKGDIVFISVSTDQDKDKWLQYMKQHTHETISIHVSSSYLSYYKIAFIPRFMLIDKDFTLLDPYAPRPSQPEAEALLKSLK